MKREIIVPFVTAAAEVLVTETGVTLKRGKLSLQSFAVITDDVATLVGIVGGIQGMILLNLSLSTCLALLSRMLGYELTEFDELARSGIAELGNVIAGRAATKLSEAGRGADITVPTIIVGRGTRISAPSFPRLVVPLETTCGTLELHLAVREVAANVSDGG